MGVVVSASSGKVYATAPAGAHQAVSVDVVDLGLIESDFNGEKKKKHKVNLVWQLNEVNEETGKRFTVRRRFTASLHEKSTLRAVLESWRGRPFTKEELKGFDLDAVLKANALVNVVHHTAADGNVYANVAAVMPLPKGLPRMEPLDYVREQDRPKDEQQSEQSEERQPGEDDDETATSGF
jgi:hypothetical protein